MDETPEWFDDNMRNGMLIVGVYFKVMKDYVQNEARKWLKNSLRNKLKEYVDEIEPIEYALVRYLLTPEDRAKKILEMIPNEVKKQLANDNNLHVEELEYALTRYISPVKERGKPGRAKGGEYKYLIRNATPEFYKKLFHILEDKKNKGPEWFGDYYVLVSRRLVKEVVLDGE